MELREIHFNYMKEILNLGIGKAANILNSMLNSHIIMSIPEIELVNSGNMNYLEETEKMAVVELPFNGVLSGVSMLVFPLETSHKLVQVLIEFEDDDDFNSDFDAVSAGSLSEIGNIVLNSVMGMFANTLNLSLQYTLSSFHEETFNEMLKDIDAGENSILLARVSFTVESLDLNGDILIFFETWSVNTLIKLINNLIET